MTRVDANGTTLRLRALHVLGHDCSRIARALGVADRLVQRIVQGRVATVTTQLRDAVIDLYDAWWDRRAPEHTRTGKAAAAAARHRAVGADWCAPAGLDDEVLDQPGYTPSHRYRPALGTGVAPDFPLDSRRSA
jgi:hypothetical protein